MVVSTKELNLIVKDMVPVVRNGSAAPNTKVNIRTTRSMAEAHYDILMVTFIQEVGPVMSEAVKES